MACAVSGTLAFLLSLLLAAHGRRLATSSVAVLGCVAVILAIPALLLGVLSAEVSMAVAARAVWDDLGVCVSFGGLAGGLVGRVIARHVTGPR